MRDVLVTVGGLPKTRAMNGGMPVNSKHLDYDAALPAWLRDRDVIAGEDAEKAAGKADLLKPKARDAACEDAAMPARNPF